MKKIRLILLTTILAFNAYAQIAFERAYFIDNSDQKNECLIKNLDWKNNPIAFEYKLSDSADIKTASIENVKEFGIYSSSKYIRATVKMDRSTTNINNLSSHRNPDFNEELLFLKVLVHGKANLYQFADEDLERFFYNLEDSGIVQLIHKVYNSVRSGTKYIRHNNSFKQQLLNNLTCPSFKAARVESLRYSKRDLVKYFVEYNECNNANYLNFEQSKSKNLLNISVRPGVNYSSLSLVRFVDNRFYTDFGSKLGARIGFEFEFVLPFNKNKWAIIGEPSYQYFISETGVGSQRVTVDYKTIEIPVGIRHYMFLNNDSKFFVNAQYAPEFSLNSNVKFEGIPAYDITAVYKLAYGFGFKYNDKYSVELRYLPNSNVMKQEASWDSDYSTVSLIVGYTIFQNK